MQKLDPAQLALLTTNHVPAMIAFWDQGEKCVFSNDAYREWFGRSPEEMKGMTLREFLGPLYEVNLPHIRGALRGERQVFERQLRLPGGEVRETIATYMPLIVNGVVQGFCVHVADVTILREREAALHQAIRERDAAAAEVRALRGMLPTCGFCKAIRDEAGVWRPMEVYIGARADVRFTHTFCPPCGAKHYPDLFGEEELVREA